MVVDENFLIEDLDNIQKIHELEEKQIAKQKNIDYEYGLYKCFCKLCGIKIFEYSSLLYFLNYCKENSIKLM